LPYRLRLNSVFVRVFVEPPAELRIELPLSEANAIATVENNPMLTYTFDHREAVYEERHLRRRDPWVRNKLIEEGS
ncbi:uncharacterized protein METZ01_LOCUS352387, partial [marine metagenome]